METSELRSKPLFERYLQSLLNMVEAEETSQPFDKGYAFGKAIVRVTILMSPDEKQDFQDGIDTGIEVERMQKHQIN